MRIQYTLDKCFRSPSRPLSNRSCIQHFLFRPLELDELRLRFFDHKERMKKVESWEERLVLYQFYTKFISVKFCLKTIVLTEQYFCRYFVISD